MTSTDYAARCIQRSCPVRFRTGTDRACPLHADQDSEDTLLKRMAAFTAMAAIPGEREANDGAPGSGDGQ